MFLPSTADPEQWARAVRAHHTRTLRVEVWQDGKLVATAAPGVLGGEVVDEWVTVGTRRNLSMTVAPNKQWHAWLDGPIEVRPWRGIRLAPSLTVECPLGLFPILPPERARSAEPITLQANDLWDYVADDTEMVPQMSAPGLLTGAIVRLLAGAGLTGTRVGSVDVMASRQVLLVGTRQEAVTQFATALGAEVFIDRFGTPRIEEARVLETPTSQLLVGVGGPRSVRVKPDWSTVFNVVIAKSSATDLGDLPERSAQITDPYHPANPRNLGSPNRPRYRSMRFDSPLLRNSAQVLKAAQTRLVQVSRAAESYEYQCIPNPATDSGDSTLASTRTGQKVFQIDRVTHPLTVDGDDVSTVTTVNTLVAA